MSQDFISASQPHWEFRPFFCNIPFAGQNYVTKSVMRLNSNVSTLLLIVGKTIPNIKQAVYW
jgi:hypothetical protein